MPISLVLDIIISVLLVLTIAYAMRLNQRLSQLRSDKNELLQLAKTFADATVRAEASIQQLKISSDALQADVKKAEALKDDLSYLVDRGGRTADEMVANVRSPGPGGEPVAARAPKKAPVSRDMGRDMDRGMDRGMGRGAPQNDDPDARLIEEAIRAAAPEAMAQDGGRDAGRKRHPSLEERAAVTRRIAGRPASAANTGGGAGRTAGALATRGLGAPEADMDEDAIEDTEAARELLKALSAVK